MHWRAPGTSELFLAGLSDRFGPPFCSGVRDLKSWGFLDRSFDY